MPTQAKGRPRRTADFVPLVEPLEDRRLLAGAPFLPYPAGGPTPGGGLRGSNTGQFSPAPWHGFPRPADAGAGWAGGWWDGGRAAPAGYGGHPFAQDFGGGDYRGSDMTVVIVVDFLFAEAVPAPRAPAGPQQHAPSNPAEGGAGDNAPAPPDTAAQADAGVTSAAPPANRGSTGQTADRAVVSDIKSTTSAGPLPTGAVSAALSRGPEALAFGASVQSAAPPAATLIVRARDDETIYGPRAPASPEDSGPPPVRPQGRAHDAPAVAPQVEGLLTDGILLGVNALGRAVEALVEPVAAGGGVSGALYWLGISCWLLAAALACEGARRRLARRAEDHPARSADPTALPLESDP